MLICVESNNNVATFHITINYKSKETNSCIAICNYSISDHFLIIPNPAPAICFLFVMHTISTIVGYTFLLLCRLCCTTFLWHTAWGQCMPQTMSTKIHWWINANACTACTTCHTKMGQLQNGNEGDEDEKEIGPAHAWYALYLILISLTLKKLELQTEGIPNCFTTNTPSKLSARYQKSKQIFLNWCVSPCCCWKCKKVCNNCMCDADVYEYVCM